MLIICGDDGVATERANAVPENLKTYLYESGLDAIEVHSARDSMHYRWVSEVDGRTRSLATLLTFDAHNVEHFCQPDRVTHIKMTRLGLTGLKQALSFPDTRIRFPNNLPTAPSPRILGIRIQGNEDSFFEDVTIALAENLNCVIGVRGSGKSTVVECLRYVFGYNETLDELDSSLAESVRSRQSGTLCGSIIRVAYRTSAGDVRILEATFDEKADYATKVFTLDGDPLEIDNVEATGDFPLRLYGWSEIESLGREHGRQRDLLDRLIPELLPVLQRCAEIRNQLRASRGEIAPALQQSRRRLPKAVGKSRDSRNIRRTSNGKTSPKCKNFFRRLTLKTRNADCLCGWKPMPMN